MSEESGMTWFHSDGEKWCNEKCIGPNYRCPKLLPTYECEIDKKREEEQAEQTDRVADFSRIMREHIPAASWVPLFAYLCEAGFFDAPASIHHHGAYPGALYDHSRAVTQALVNLTERLDLKWEQERSPYIVGMFHDLCKVDNYKHKDGSGEAWEYNNAALLPGHGEKSVILLQRFLVLTEEEMLCIRWHMGAFDDKEKWNSYGRACTAYPNVLYTHTADMIAARVLGV